MAPLFATVSQSQYQRSRQTPSYLLRTGLIPITNRGYPEPFDFTSCSAALPQIQYLLRLLDRLSIYHATEIEHQMIAIRGMLFWRRGPEGLPQRLLELLYRSRSMSLVLKLKRKKGKDTPNNTMRKWDSNVRCPESTLHFVWIPWLKT